MNEATTILNKVGGSSHEAARVIDAANGNSTKAIQVLDSAGNSIDKTVTIIVYTRKSVGFKLKCGLSLKEELCMDTK